jgi:dTMP kinase
MKRKDDGILIAFEGIDGAGKTTQVELLVKFLQEYGEPVVRSKEPTDGEWGRKIRQSASNGRMTLPEEIHAFIEDRKEHVRNLILPALSESKTVILDRYFHSTIAYQGARGGNVSDLETTMLSIAPNPDVVVLLDVPPEVGLSRIRNGRNENPNAFEDARNLEKVREIFQRLSKTMPEFVIINGTMDIESVHKAVLTGLYVSAAGNKWCAKEYGCYDKFNCGPRMTGECRLARLMGLKPHPSYDSTATP